jgi:two-component system sensor histidine kinase KdpD
MFAATIAGVTSNETRDLLPAQADSPPATAAPRVRKIIPGRDYWRASALSLGREYAEVFGLIGAVTVAGWFAPVSYHVFGHIFLLVVIALSVRVGRWPVFVAAVVSGVTWNFVFIPPRLSFSVLEFDDTLLLGTYFVAALLGGQLTARIRAEERRARRMEQRASALFHLTRALAAAQAMDEAAAAALGQADELFEASTALLLRQAGGGLAPHPAGALRLCARELAVAEVAHATARAAGRFTPVLATGEILYLPLRRGDQTLGVFAVKLRGNLAQLSPTQRDLLDGFASQIALLVERELLRAAGEREKLLAESDRLHRTLLDSVSHELKTPLAVLRSAAEKLDTDDAQKRTGLLGEVRTATRRLDYLVANLLDQTRLESGALSPQLDWCDVRDLLAAARRGVGDALDRHGFQSEVPSDLPLFWVDAILMEHVLANLLLNAALHTPAGGRIRVEAGMAAGAQHVFLAVNDSGPGIPPDLEATLFQKFQRGAHARPGGLGLGLSIVRGFMQAQGGDVAVRRSVEGGASFIVTLPHRRHEGVPVDDVEAGG